MASNWGAENPYRNASGQAVRRDRQERAKAADRKAAASTAGRGQRRV
jgi:hypothetical protein